MRDKSDRQRKTLWHFETARILARSTYGVQFTGPEWGRIRASMIEVSGLGPDELGIYVDDFIALHRVRAELRREEYRYFNMNQPGQCIFGLCRDYMIDHCSRRGDVGRSYYEFNVEAARQLSYHADALRRLCEPSSVPGAKFDDQKLAAHRIGKFLRGERP